MSGTVGMTAGSPWRPARGNSTTMKEGRLPGNRVNAVRWPSWKGIRGSKTAQAIKDAIDESGALAAVDRAAQRAPRPYVPMPHHDLGQSALWWRYSNAAMS